MTSESRFDSWFAEQVPWLFDELAIEVTLFTSSGEETGLVYAIPTPSIYTEEMIEEGQGVQVVKYERKRIKLEPPENPELFASVEVDGRVFDIEGIEDRDGSMCTLMLCRRVRMREYRRDVYK